MRRLTIAYANHRPETIRLSTPIMRSHDVVVLEEPPHSDLQAMLEGNVEPADYLLDQDIEYPAFSTEQCRLLQSLHRDGVTVLQAEPFVEKLLAVQEFFAAGGAPAELDTSTVEYRVYASEKEATRTLIAFYEASRQNDFDRLIKAMQDFARADAERFRLRDLLRARAIAALVADAASVCVEAGPMHLLLFRELRAALPAGWVVRPVFVEGRALAQIGCKTGLYGPGDKLTAHYLLGTGVSGAVEDLLCARTLIFMKIVGKEEFSAWQTDFPHLRNECFAGGLVRRLSYARCRALFAEIGELSAAAALARVEAAARL